MNNQDTKKLILVGASGFGREVAWLVERINSEKQSWEILGFLDDNQKLVNEKINGYRVLGQIKDAVNYKDEYFVCCIGSSMIRKKIIDELVHSNPEIKFAKLVDPDVIMSNYVNIGEGSIICAGTILTVNIDIGNHVIINLDCTIGHDAILNDYVTLYPSVNISGQTVVKKCTEIGTGSQVIQGKNIGQNSIIGAGSVVINDLESNVTAVGVPSIPIKTIH
ncbi:acetyltransferase [Anaerococcus jeddahensis]|uniref:acetyltransferase n=1 Tax=Anaerococcus jeddahensis TaxID=1673719 RepID=UPI000672410C|nr:acetyltransferase [Anaerococcus jeddahensis]